MVRDVRLVGFSGPQAPSGGCPIDRRICALSKGEGDWSQPAEGGVAAKSAEIVLKCSRWGGKRLDKVRQ